MNEWGMKLRKRSMISARDDLCTSMYNLYYAHQTFKNLVEILPLNFLCGVGNLGPFYWACGQHFKYTE
jgi:hypothetical protein